MSDTTSKCDPNIPHLHSNYLHSHEKMAEILKFLNNCLEIFNLCKPKDSPTTNNSSNKTTDLEGEKLIDMSDYFTLILPSRPKFGDEIRVKAKLKERPKE